MASTKTRTRKMQQTLREWYIDMAGSTATPSERIAAAGAASGFQVMTGFTSKGIRWAASGRRRAVAYAEGGCQLEAWVDGIGWTVAEDADADEPSWHPLLSLLGMAV